MTMIPNLDAMSIEELMAFWFEHQHGRNSKELFPDGGKGTRTATNDLSCYASNIATAKRCRLNGDIPTALMYEGICERIYSRLPEDARW
jgi:hypothetical protein